jgi:hypothetical protein
MRSLLFVAVVAAAALAGTFIAQPTSAKTVLQIAPQTGAPGSTIRVEGIGFCAQPVRLLAVDAGAMPQAIQGGGFISKSYALPTAIELASLRAGDGGFVTNVTVPPLVDLRRLTGEPSPASVDILAVGEGTSGCNREEANFVTGVTLAIDGVTLPAAGSPTEESSGIRWPIILAALISAGLFASVAGAWRHGLR